MWQLGCQIKPGKANSRASLLAAISRHHVSSTHTHMHSFLSLTQTAIQISYGLHKLCSRSESFFLPHMDTEAHTVLWKWSHPWTMQSSWPSSPGSRKSGCVSGGLTVDPSNTRPVLTVSQAFIFLWPRNICQTTTEQSQSRYPQSHAFFPGISHHDISMCSLLQEDSFCGSDKIPWLLLYSILVLSDRSSAFNTVNHIILTDMLQPFLSWSVLIVYK